VRRYVGLERRANPDWSGLLDNILRRGTPKRVFLAELFMDPEVEDAIAARFDLASGFDASDPHYKDHVHMAVWRFCGYDYIPVDLSDFEPSAPRLAADDTAGLARSGGRLFVNEQSGPIATWDDLERFHWPETSPGLADRLEWFSTHAPDDMCLIAWGGFGSYAEWLSSLFGYEGLCYALYDNRDLVRACSDRLRRFGQGILQQVLGYERVKLVWASDDMGFKTGPLISPADMREFVLPSHKALASMTHAAGRPYLLHSCGDLSSLLDDLIDDVHIDAKHSFEDTIGDVRVAKGTYGRRVALLGGIDVDFLCRASEPAIRRRVRETLDICLPGGGYCLGTGNSVANYIPLENYLTMIDEGLLYS
jgi:uroporphyrinogen decarboxylase